MPSLESLSDEDLIVMWRVGQAEGCVVLTERYCHRQEELLRRASYALSRILASQDPDLLFATAFENCLHAYQPGKGPFLPYFLNSLRHDMSKAAAKEHLLDGQSVLSLDNKVPGLEGELTFHDALAANGEDPRDYVNLLEEARRLGKIKDDLAPEVLDVARLRNDGCSFRAVAEAKGINIKKARKLYARYEKYVKTKVKIGPHSRRLKTQKKS